MSKAVIKVIKRNLKDGAEPPQPVTETPKTADKARRKLENTIKDWISERNANRRTEKAYSNDRILAWEMPP